MEMRLWTGWTVRQNVWRENRLANRICVTVICNGHWSSINYNFNAVLNGNFTVRMPIKRPPSQGNGSVPTGHFRNCSGMTVLFRPILLSQRWFQFLHRRFGRPNYCCPLGSMPERQL
jgi:hypothetical protein